MFPNEELGNEANGLSTPISDWLYAQAVQE